MIRRTTAAYRFEKWNKRDDGLRQFVFVARRKNKLLFYVGHKAYR